MAGGNASNVESAQLTLSHLGSSDAGAYTCEIKLGALTLTTLPAQVSILTRPVVTPTAPPAAIVSGVYSWQIAASESPASFRVTGLPSGLGFNHTTGLVSGTPSVGGTYQVKVTATNAAGASVVQTFTLTIAPLPAGVVGTFDGVLGRDGNLDGDLGGTVTATVAPAGGFSGKFLLGASTYPFLGRVQATVQHDPTAVLTLIRPGSTPITVTLAFDSAGHALTGTLTRGGHSTSLLAGRRTWNATTNPATQFAGSYNVALDLTAATIGDLAYPQGSGSVQLKVTKAGAVSVVSTMSDGSALSSSAHLWPDGRIPMFKLLNANRGSLRGLAKITSAGRRRTSAGTGWPLRASIGSRPERPVRSTARIGRAFRATASWRMAASTCRSKRCSAERSSAGFARRSWKCARLLPPPPPPPAPPPWCASKSPSSFAMRLGISSIESAGALAGADGSADRPVAKMVRRKAAHRHG